MTLFLGTRVSKRDQILCHILWSAIRDLLLFTFRRHLNHPLERLTTTTQPWALIEEDSDFDDKDYLDDQYSNADATILPTCPGIIPSHPPAAIIPMQTITPPGKGNPAQSPVTVCPTNKACQLELKLWAAQLGHCGEDQLTALVTHVNRLPNTFKIEWKELARIQKQAAQHIARKLDEVGVHLYMDFSFMGALTHDYVRSDIKRDRIIESYDG